MSMKTETVAMTPDLARAYLSNNGGNRRLSTSKVTQYAAKMTAGQWRLSHQGIALDESGVLLDGQHRLAAVVASECTVLMRVTIGVPREVFPSIDNGMTRQAGQVLPVPQGFATAALLRILARVEEGKGTIQSAGSVPTEVVFEMLDRYPEAVEAASRSHNMRPFVPAQAAHGAILLQAMRSPYAELIDSWNAGIRDGIGLPPGSPILLLRNRFARQTARQIGSPRDSYVLIAKAWNAHVRGERIGVLKCYPTEPLPKVLGFKQADGGAA